MDQKSKPMGEPQPSSQDDTEFTYMSIACEGCGSHAGELKWKSYYCQSCGDRFP